MASEAVVVVPCDMPEGYTFQAVVDGRDIPVTVPVGGVKKGQEIRIPLTNYFASSMPVAVATEVQSNSVVAVPYDMPGGTTFRVVVDGREIPVTVPAGGAQQGQEIPIPNTTASVNGTTLATPVTLPSIVVGNNAWRHKLCDCGQVCCSGLWWFACCCPSLVMGQMLTRMNLDFCGSTTASSSAARNAYTVVLTCFLVSLVGNSIIPGLSLAFCIYAIIYGTRLRSYMRQKYKIAGSCTETALDDCCCVFWCGCCVSIQMARHTQHEDSQYDCCTFNGLRRGTSIPTNV